MILSITLWHLPVGIYGQSTVTATSKSTSAAGSSVSSSVTVEVSNETLKAKTNTLTTAVIGFLNSGANVLKTAVTDQTIMKTKINNRITNATQNMEGAEATNAIIPVEISKALRSINSTYYNSGKVGSITIDTSSTCKPATKNISCENGITLR